MSNDRRHAHPVRPREPLAKLVYEAMVAAGWSQAKVAKEAALSSQHVSQLVNRRRPYKQNRLPDPETLQGLAKIPGLTILDVTKAARESAGIGDEPKVTEMTSGLRRNVHNVVDEFPDDRLAGVLQVLLALRDFTRDGGGNRR